MRPRRRPPAAPDALRRARFEASFAEVYEPLQRYVRRRAAHHVVDDVVADALSVLWRRLDDVPDGQLLPWCYGVARRCLANHRRGDQRALRLRDRLAAQLHDVADPGSGDAALDAALATLSADDREIVRLWAWEGLPPRDIGAVMAMTANAVSIRLHRARRSLATTLSTTRDDGDVGKELSASGHTAVEDTPVTTEEAG